MSAERRDAAKDELYTALDGLHGQVLRAKHCLTERDDRGRLADLVADVVYRAKEAETLWQSYEATR